MLNKVPEVTLAFWVIKIMSTTVGETGSDYLAVHVGLGTAITDGVMFTLLAVSMLLQLGARRYVPWRYWLTVVLISVVGTEITDFLTDTARRQPLCQHRRLRRRIGSDVCCLVWRRAHALDPHDPHAPARAVLLDGDPVHVCARNRGRRPRD